MSPSDQDDKYEHDIMVFMTSLERVLAPLAQKEGNKHVVAALDVSRELVRRVVEFSEKRFADEHLTVAFAKAQDVFTDSNVLQKSLSRLSARALAGILENGASDVSDYRFAYREVCRKLVEALKAYFAVLAAGFQNQEKGAMYRDTFDVFAADVEHVW